MGECKSQGSKVQPASCDDNGNKYRTRECNNPAPADGGEECLDEYGFLSLTEEVSNTCYGYCQPVNGAWSVWSSWGDCSKPCGEGEKSKTRTCSNPAPEHGGNQCWGPPSDTEKCNEQACSTNGISAVCNDDNTISVEIKYDQ